MILKRKIVILVSLLSLGLVSCSDDDGDKPDASSGNNTAPVAAFTMSPDCTSSSSTEITFTSTSTDTDGDTLTCSWSFNSGSPSTSNDCTTSGVTFPNAAPYNVTLMIDDGNGGTDSASMSIAPC